MTMKTTTLLMLSILAVPSALADERAPDCEAGQPWIGYGSSEPAREAYDDAGAPGGLATCEGEHWDGQDPATGADPNAHPSDDALQPGAAGASTGAGLYAYAHVAFVARAAVHADQGSVALYVRDNTPGNLVASAADPLSPTGPAVAESDCDQTAYAARHATGDRWRCARDNTAITLEHALLP